MKTFKQFKTVEKERAILVQVIHGRQREDEAAESLDELASLADTAGAIVVGNVTQRRHRPTGSFFVGEGKLSDIKMACAEAKANMVIFDNDLTPIQVNNLDMSLGMKVIDRTELILQIFAIRARSAEAQIQVELAQLQYLISRLPVSEKQARFTGGIGMKGPGESPLQLRNEPMRKRIRDLKKKLEGIQLRRDSARTRRRLPAVSLVGYTNVGKSTLLNAMAHADAYVDDRLFATLDTKTRLLHLPNGKNVLLTDTVGFIRNLPHGLVASFRSTLSVASEADLLLIVLDAAHERWLDHVDVVTNTLKEISAESVPSLVVLNKCDVPGSEKQADLITGRFPEAIRVSAVTGDGLNALKKTIMEKLETMGTFKGGRNEA